jgi:hypothetical protein
MNYVLPPDKVQWCVCHHVNFSNKHVPPTERAGKTKETKKKKKKKKKKNHE